MNETLTKTHLGERLEDDRTDWKRVDALSDADLAHAILDDPDAFEPGADWIAKAALPQPARAKERITMRLDADMLEWFRWRGYQTRMNAVLRAYFAANTRGR